jgi:hypothetical protein
MTRTDVRLRQSLGTIEIDVEGKDEWRKTSLSKTMKFDSRSIPDVKSLLDSYLDTKFLEIHTWDLRIAEQRKIGCALRQSIFGDSKVRLGTHLHIIPVLNPEDPKGNRELLDVTCRVPWSLLTTKNDEKSDFLALNPVRPTAISFDADPQTEPRPDCYEIRLPSAPKLLLVMPEVKHENVETGTAAEAHRKSILEMLEPYYKEVPTNIECVRTVEEFQAAFTDKNFPHDIIYFYGHGRSLDKGAIFEFEKDGKTGVPNWIQIDIIHEVIHRAVTSSRRPPFVFFNACQGAAASQESALRTFATSASCVIAMRSVVWMDASRTLAEKVLKSVIIDGFAPPVAVREALRKMPLTWMRSGHWASIAIAVQYSEWTSLGMTKPIAEANDAVGDFPSRVDRSEPLAEIEKILQENLNSDPTGNGPSVILWAGSRDEMPTEFSERTRDVIIERFPGHRPLFYDVTLQQGVSPDATDDLEPQLYCGIYRAFVNELDIDVVRPIDVISVIQNISPGRKGILVLFHGPLSPAHVKLVSDYIALWGTICEGLGDDMAPRIALAFGFEVDATGPMVPPAGSDAIFLGSVPPAEIKAHLSRYRHYYRGVSDKTLDDKTEKLATNSSGVFSKLVEQLRQLADFTS